MRGAGLPQVAMHSRLPRFLVKLFLLRGFSLLYACDGQTDSVQCSTVKNHNGTIAKIGRRVFFYIMQHSVSLRPDNSRYYTHLLTIIIVLHCRLIATGKSCQKVLLLTYLERGSMYKQLKETVYRGAWLDVCKNDLEICSRTANRFILFFELIGSYPRIIISEISFESIMFCRDGIISFLEKNNDWAIRFSTPLRELKITANVGIEGECLPVSDSYTVPAGSQTEQDEWNAGWETSDEILARNE